MILPATLLVAPPSCTNEKRRRFSARASARVFLFRCIASRYTKKICPLVMGSLFMLPIFHPQS